MQTSKDDSENSKRNSTSNGKNRLLVNSPLTELFGLIEQHQKHLQL